MLRCTVRTIADMKRSCRSAPHCSTSGRRQVVGSNRLGRGLIMSDVDSDRGKGDGGQEISGRFVVACGDPAQMLEFVEEALDQVALAIAFEVDGAYHPDVALAGDVGGGSACGEEFDDAAGAVAAVGDRVAGGPQSGDEAGQGGVVRRLGGWRQR